MKKLITGLVFSLLILMACVSPILADGASVVLDLTEMQRYEMASSLCWIDDSLYVLGNKGVYSWKSGSEKMNTVIDLAATSNYDYVQDCPEDESEAAVWNQMLQLIFTDGEALYGLHPYSGMIKKIEGNAQTDVAEIQREYLYSEDMEAYREIRQAVYTDKKLYLLLGTDTYEEYDKTELYAFNLDTSEMELVDIEGVNSIMLGAEGTLDEMRYPKFVAWLRENMADSVVKGSVEIVGKPEHDGYIIYSGGWKEEGRVPQYYDYSGYAILSVKPADEAAIVMELNNKKMDKEDGTMDEKTKNELMAAVTGAVSEVNSKWEEYWAKVDTLLAEIS